MGVALLHQKREDEFTSLLSAWGGGTLLSSQVAGSGSAVRVSGSISFAVDAAGMSIHVDDLQFVIFVQQQIITATFCDDFLF